MCRIQFSVDYTFINNFPMSAASYNLVPQNETIDITIEETHVFISRSEILQDELLILEDSMVYNDSTSLVRKVIQETNGSWKTITYV